MANHCKTAILVFAALLLCGCDTVLYSDLREESANEVLAALRDQGIKAHKQAGEEGKFKVLVEETQFPKAMRILDNKGLPAFDYDTFGTVFKKEGILSSPLEEKARYIYAMSQEVSQTISKIDGVLAARVHIVLPQNDELGAKICPSSVAVFIRYNPEVASNLESRATDIKKLVENSIQELSYDRIHITFFAAVNEAPVHSASGSQTVSIAGVEVAESSVAKLYTAAGVLGFLVLALAGSTIFLALRSGTPAKKG